MNVGAVGRWRPLLTRAVVRARPAEVGSRQRSTTNHLPQLGFVCGQLQHSARWAAAWPPGRGRTGINDAQLGRWSSTDMGEETQKKQRLKQEVTLEELSKLIDSDQVNLVDVREAYELRDKGAIPKAINIPLNHLRAVLELPPEDFKNIFKRDKPGRDDDIIFSCAAGVRSRLAMGIAEELGFTKARHYPGGYQEWDQMKNNS